MLPEFDRQADGVGKSEAWDRVLSDAGPCDHIVQLYQGEDFLNPAVCRFASAAIANEEGVTLAPTSIRPRIESEGVNVEAAERGQLAAVAPYFMTISRQSNVCRSSVPVSLCGPLHNPRCGLGYNIAALSLVLAIRLERASG
jgi:hypothetical protein